MEIKHIQVMFMQAVPHLKHAITCDRSDLPVTGGEIQTNRTK